MCMDSNIIILLLVSLIDQIDEDGIIHIVIINYSPSPKQSTLLVCRHFLFGYKIFTSLLNSK